MSAALVSAAFLTASLLPPLRELFATTTTLANSQGGDLLLGLALSAAGGLCVVLVLLEAVPGLRRRWGALSRDAPLMVFGIWFCGAWALRHATGHAAWEWSGWAVFLFGWAWWAQRRRLAEERRRSEALARASHDLRTPASGIRALSDALSSGAISEPAERRRCLALIREEAERLERGLARILSSARGDSLVRTPARVGIDLAEWAEGLVRRWRHRLPELKLEAPHGALALVDPELLDEAADALLDNALRYGGRRVEVGVRAAGDRVELRIGDDGTGLPADAVAWVRSLTDQEKSDRPERALPESVGLGLFVSAEVARAHGGSLRCPNPRSLVLSLPRLEAAA